MAPTPLHNPVSAYTSTERLARERETLFRLTPLLFGFSSQLAEPGDCLVADESGVPIVVVRQSDGTLRAFINVCGHRGARVVQESGHLAGRFSCPYHAWTYDRCGALQHIPYEEGFDGVDRARHTLRPLPVTERHGLIWVRPSPLEPGEPPLDIDTQLGGLAAELASYGFANYHHFATRTLRPRVNWKLPMDTFMETYHLSTLHPDTVAPLILTNLTLSDGFGRNHRMAAIRKTIRDLRAEPPEKRDFLRQSALVYTIFPNTIFIYQIDHVEVWQSFPDPERVDACTVHLSFYIPESATTEKSRAHWEANLKLALDTVDQQDFRLCEQIQQNFSAAARDTLIYGRNEPALIHYHQSLRDALGLEKIA